MALSILFLYSSDAVAQRKKDKKKPELATVAAKPAGPATIAEKVKKCKKTEGLFTLFQDTTTGSMMLLIKREQINKEFIYFSYIENGNTTTGHNKGTFRDNKVFQIKRYFNQIEFITQNTSFYFDPSNAISKSANSNIANAVMSSEVILASDESKGEYLINADNLFLSEVLYQIKRMSMMPPMMNGAFNLGGLNKAKTHYETIKSYPENTDIIVRYVYDDPMSRGSSSDAITDGRYVEILLQHSFIEMPNNGYVPRYDDPRIGYFITEVNDMTTLDNLNYKDLIHRWHLVKKDPSALLSEPVKPITWWIENTTPKDLRPTIRAAILQWNLAFEKAGFKNAIEINEQPDNADWDAGDIRYNVLRWTSSPEPPFGGYGPSFVNPRTGEILGADIMLEWIFITNRLRSQRVFDKAGIEWLMQIDGNEYHDPHGCQAGEHMHMQNLLGLQYLAMNKASESDVNEFIKESIYYLILHEVGHTLGLNHNMKASQLHSPDVLYDRSITESIGLTGSVMDYPAANFSNRVGKKSQYYTTRPGPYDLWAIEFGYYQENTLIEDQARRQNILARSTEPALCFGNDADDMRSPGKAIDPRVMIGDMSSDAVGYAKERIGFIKTMMSNLYKEYGTENRSFNDLRGSYIVLSSEWAVQAGVISRYIGGVYVDRSFSNQKSLNKPYTAVPYELQKNAMKALAELVFAPNAMEIPAELMPYLQMQRRGFNFFASGEDPKIHDRILNVQNMVLVHLLHPNTLQRISDSKLYGGNKYELSEMFKDLSNAIFQADMTGEINSYRQNLQSLYIQYLGAITKSPQFDYLSKSKAYNQLVNLQKQIQASLPSSTLNAKEHKNYILSSIKQILEPKH
ncbi:MAG: zinc-dependent metalloprotease [Bacteroidia bacterium]|nr:zinc-dependent metalloprotease [Bacteroidia bacterium]